MKKIAASISPTTELLTIECKDCGNKFLFIMPPNKLGIIKCHGCPHKIQISELEDAIIIDPISIGDNVNNTEIENAETTEIPVT